MARPSVYSKEEILAAASKIITEDGGAKLTMDRVAKAAGISKGGLLHLFPSKKHIFQGLIEQFKETLLTTFQVDSSSTPKEKLAAYIQAHVDGIRANAFYTNLFTAAINDASLLEDISGFYRQSLLEFTGDELPFEQVALIMMAVEGVAMFHALGIHPLDETQEKKLIKHVFALIEQ